MTLWRELALLSAKIDASETTGQWGDNQAIKKISGKAFKAIAYNQHLQMFAPEKSQQHSAAYVRAISAQCFNYCTKQLWICFGEM